MVDDHASYLSGSTPPARCHFGNPGQVFSAHRSSSILNLQLHDEFKSERLKGTTIDFSADKPTSALQRSAGEFLSITYPSVDLLRVFEATQPNKSRPVVLLGGRGLGKSHLMAALWHGMKDPTEANKWLADWATVKAGRQG